MVKLTVKCSTFFISDIHASLFIVKFMSHEVTDLEPVFEFLSSMDSTKSELWEARYICFIWLSLICMIPFDLKKVDSGLQSQVSSDLSKHNKANKGCSFFFL